MSDEGRIVIFTGVHGNIDRFEQTAAAIQAIVTFPALHIIADDFSTNAQGARLRELEGTVECANGAPLERKYIQTGMLGCLRSPNYGVALAYAWDCANETDAEALWVVESDVIPHVGCPEALREVVGDNPEAGAIAPLYVKRGSTLIASFGGVDDWPEDGEDFGGVRVGSELRERDLEEVCLGLIPWAHLACTWFPRTVLQSWVSPDPDFSFYYLDHDLCEQIKEADMEIIVTPRAVAEHTPGGSSHVRWRNGSKRDRVRETAYEQLCDKWPHIKD